MQYLSFPDSLSSVLANLSSLECTSAVRSKAAYALSGLLKHNATAVRLLDELDGWSVLKGALQGTSNLSLYSSDITDILYVQ